MVNPSKSASFPVITRRFRINLSYEHIKENTTKYFTAKINLIINRFSKKFKEKK